MDRLNAPTLGGSFSENNSRTPAALPLVLKVFNQIAIDTSPLSRNDLNPYLAWLCRFIILLKLAFERYRDWKFVHALVGALITTFVCGCGKQPQGLVSFELNEPHASFSCTLGESGLNVPLAVNLEGAQAYDEIEKAGITVHLRATNIGRDTVTIGLYNKGYSNEALALGASGEVYNGKLADLVLLTHGLGNVKFYGKGKGSIKLDWNFDFLNRLPKPVSISIWTDPYNPPL